MPPDITVYSLATAAVITFAGSLVKSTSGFGFALVSVPLLLLLWDPIYVVPVIIPLAFTTDALICFNNRKVLEPRRVALMVVAGLAGIPLGAYVLLAAHPDTLRLAIAVLVISAGTLLLFGFTIDIKKERMAGGLVGFVSGVMASSSGLAGVPVSLFMINQKWAKTTFRTSISLYFLFIDVSTILMLATTGALTFDTLKVTAVLWLPVLLAYRIATLILPYIKQDLFIRIATAIVMGSGVVAIADSIW